MGIRRRVGGASCALLFAAACGGAADDREGDAMLYADTPVAVPPRVLPSKPVTPRDPSLPARDELPPEIAGLLSAPPERIDVAEFDALLGYYCLDCHVTPACADACDGFSFDDWEHLSRGGNGGSDDVATTLRRVIARMENGSMPPEGQRLAHPLPGTPRQLMIDFIEGALSGSL